MKPALFVFLLLLVLNQAMAKPRPAAPKPDSAPSKTKIVHVLELSSGSFTGLKDKLVFESDGTVVFKTSSPATRVWDTPYAVGEFTTTINRSVFSRLYGEVKKRVSPHEKVVLQPDSIVETFTLDDGSAHPPTSTRVQGTQDSFFESWKPEFRKISEAALGKPVNAINLRCQKRGTETRCSVTAIGKKPSRLPLPGPTPYTFYCYDRQSHVTEIAKFWKPKEKSKVKGIELKPGKHYPFILPVTATCDRSIMLSIGYNGGIGGMFEESLLVSGPIEAKAGP